MLVLFFGVVEYSQGVAVDRKITIIARTLADLVSQNTSVTDAQFTTYSQAGGKILDPYPAGPLNQTISELYVDPNTHTAKVQWSKGDAVRATGSTVTVPTALKVDNTYLLLSEVSYLYTPTIGYVMAPSGVNLSDVAYARPRQSSCVLYNTGTCPTN
jgi:Flp pilus assembly protein TadG